MDGILEALADNPNLIVGLILGPAGMITGLLIITMVCRVGIQTKRETEQSRRELAAYVAEGSISAEEAERLLVPRPWFAMAFSGNKHAAAWKNWNKNMEAWRGWSKDAGPPPRPAPETHAQPAEVSV